MWHVTQTLYGYVLAGIGILFFIFSMTNHIWQFIRTRKPRPLALSALEPGELSISILIPARNEEENIGPCLDSFLNQDYPDYEVLVIDDNSEDATWSIIEGYAQKHPGKIRAYKGKPLPEDWQGKCWALDQVVKEARGRYLLFTDADTRHSPRSVSFAVTNLEENRADMISGYTRQTIQTFGEKITVPLQYMLTAFFLLLPLNSLFKKVPLFSTAIGQYMGVNRKKFIAIGGWSLVKKRTTEDVFLARECRKAGFRTFFLNCTSVVSCRMFSSYKSARLGLSKNIFDFLGRISAVLFAAFFMIFTFLALPVFIGVIEFSRILFLQNFLQNPALLFEPFTFCLLLNVIFTFSTWVMLFISQRLPWFYAFLYPVMFINLLDLALVSWYHSFKAEGYEWKGRRVL